MTGASSLPENSLQRPAVSSIEQAAGREEQERRQKPPPRAAHPRKGPDPSRPKQVEVRGCHHAGLGATRSLGETANTVTRAWGRGEGPGEAKRGASVCRERARKVRSTSRPAKGQSTATSKAASNTNNKVPRGLGGQGRGRPAISRPRTAQWQQPELWSRCYAGGCASF